MLFVEINAKMLTCKDLQAQKVYVAELLCQRLASMYKGRRHYYHKRYVHKKGRAAWLNAVGFVVDTWMTGLAASVVGGVAVAVGFGWCDGGCAYHKSNMLLSSGSNQPSIISLGFSPS